LSPAALMLLKKRIYYEQQRTRWWFKKGYSSVRSCLASTIFFDNLICGTAKGDLETPLEVS
jgi:hypothetical protein